MNSNKLIIFSAPSGSGKTTIVKHLLQIMPELSFSISCATRKPRTGEIDGKDYYFISPDAFKQKITQHEFVEYEEVYTDNFYGTLHTEIERIWNNNQQVIFDIDVKGGLNIKRKFGNQALAIFVQPPSVNELKNRLEGRATEPPEKIAQRLAKAEEELAFSQQFDYILINDHLEKAQEEAEKLIKNFLKAE